MNEADVEMGAHDRELLRFPRSKHSRMVALRLCRDD